TALIPLTRSSAVPLPRTRQSTALCQMPRDASIASEPIRGTFQKKFSRRWCAEAPMHTEPVSGIRAVSVVSVAPLDRRKTDRAGTDNSHHEEAKRDEG